VTETCAPSSVVRPDGTRWRTTDWWYLGFLSMLLFQPLFDPATRPWTWLVTGLAVVAFVPLYVLAWSGRSRLLRWAPALSTLLGLLVFPVNGGASVLWVYAAGFAATAYPKHVAVRWFAGLSCLPLPFVLLLDVPVPIALAFFGVPVIFVWVVGWSVLEEMERDRETARLRVDNARVAHLATATERERIARDLHDLTGHSLTSIIVRAQLVRRLVASDPVRAEAEAQALERTARAALTEVRETVSGWRQVVFDDEVAVARRALAAAGVELEVDTSGEVDLAPSVEQVLGLALREGVTNVVRHADARRCVVTLRRVGDEVVLEVTDDGSGSSTPDGNGLLGMRERLAALGGRVERTARDGTRLTVAVPARLAG
jgi:two-component system sensor histidine kinase DesK